jgi:amino acid transporter
MLVLLFALMSAGSLSAGELGRPDGGLPWLVKDVLGGSFGTALLWDVVFAVSVCALAVHAGAVRLIFAMARDGKMPFSEALARVSPVSKLPVAPAVIVGAVAIAILVVNVNLPRLIELMTMVAALWANLAYFFVLAAMLRRRTIALSVAGALWSLFMVVNLGWPRQAVYGDGLSRFAALILTAIMLAASTTSWFLTQAGQKAAAQTA